MIPTRERSDTLMATLKTCVNQDYENLEIVVSDNFSKDDTRAVVESLSDKRIRYTNTQKRVGMSQNWQHAFSLVTGDFVMYLGDDDGLLPGAITRIADYLASGAWDAFCWKPATYYWGNAAVAANRFKLVVPWATARPVERNGSMVLRDVLRRRSPYYELPIPYVRSVVRADILRNFEARTGALLWSRIPDVFLGVVVAHHVSRYGYSAEPYSIGGISQHSTGASSLNPTATRQSEQTFLSEDNLPFHPELEYAPLTHLVLWESVLQMRDRSAVSDHIWSGTTEEDHLIGCVEEASRLPTSRYYLCMEVLAKIASRKKLQHALERARARFPNKEEIERTEFQGYNIRHRQLVFDCTHTSDRTIFGASQLCIALLEMRDSNLFSLARGALITTNMRLLAQKIRRLAF